MKSIERAFKTNTLRFFYVFLSIRDFFVNKSYRFFFFVTNFSRHLRVLLLHVTARKWRQTPFLSTKIATFAQNKASNNGKRTIRTNKAQ